MSFERFMKKNKAVKENTFYPVTASLCDEEGNPLKWEIKALTTKETEAIRERHIIEIPVTGKPGMYRQKVTKDYIPSLICAAVVSPNLYDAELQDSYGVHTPQELIVEMVDNPEEYSALLQFVQSYSGIKATMDDEVNEAKN